MMDYGRMSEEGREGVRQKVIDLTYLNGDPLSFGVTILRRTPIASKWGGFPSYLLDPYTHP